MDFSISERAQQLRNRAREFVRRYVIPLEVRLSGSWKELEPALQQARATAKSLGLWVPDLGVPGKQKAKNARMIVRAGEEAGKVNVKDPKPQEGVGAGSAATETPDPKWQASPSANSVSGLEVVESHGAGSSPEEAGQVDAPNLQANRMISRETVAKFCPECAHEMARRGIKTLEAMPLLRFRTRMYSITI